jgi:hypothetical protein
MRVFHEKANPPRGGDAKPRASSQKRQPSHRKEHQGILRIYPPEYLGALATHASCGPDLLQGPGSPRPRRARGNSSTFVRTVPQIAGGERAGGDVGGGGSSLGLVRSDTLPFGVFAAAISGLATAGLR